MNRVIISAAILFITCFLFQGMAWATGGSWGHPHSNTPKVHSLADILKSGEIVGAVAFCGVQGTNGAVVDLVGESFSAVLGANGTFKLRYVPRGAYTLRISIPGQPEHTQPVTVFKRRVTDVGGISLCPDNDNDGFAVDVDCNDNNGAIFPGAEELCDGVDNDCDGAVDGPGCNCTDADNDSFFAQDGCGTAVDCNDEDDTIKPGAQEICDGIDNNCDNAIDEGFDLSTDPNNCGACSNVCSGGQCDAGLCVDLDGDGFTTDAGDCNDEDPDVFPGAPEVCDGTDNDCNGLVDDNCSVQVCTEAEVQSIQACFDSCGTDFQCQNDCFNSAGFSSQCQSAILSLLSCGVSNQCIDPNTFDNQCLNGNCPDELEKVFGFSNFPECVSGETRSCGTDVGVCTPGTQTCVDTAWSECAGSVEPTAEICDTLDNNCDGQVDEDDVCSTCGNGITESGEQCDGGPCCNSDCTLSPSTTVCRSATGQCDVEELCDGVTPNCPLDEFASQGTTCGSGLACNDTGSCVAADEDGDGFDSSVDCDETDPGVNPGATEICNGIDDNCDQTVDGDGLCGAYACGGPSGCFDVCNPNGGPGIDTFCAPDHHCEITDQDFFFCVPDVAPVCGNGVVEAGEQCDDGNTTDGDGCQANCTATISGTGTYNIQPAAIYSCALGVFNLNTQRFSFQSLGGSSIQVTGAPSGPTMTGTVDSTGSFQVGVVIPGGATENYVLTGQFSDPDNWTGIFSVGFTGNTFDCVNQNFPVTGSR